MDKTVLALVAAVSAATGLVIGVLFGAWLGRIGAMEVLRTFVRLPVLLLRSPGQIKNQWKTWGEWRARRKIERIRFRNQMKELKGKITAQRNEIRNTQA